MQTVTLNLPIDLLRSAHAAAVDRDETVAKMVEALLTRELSERSGTGKTETANDRIIFALQGLLFRDMAEASSWDDLSDRLDRHGYWLKLTREGLILHTETNGSSLCNCADLGFGYVTFVRRFGAGVPRNPYGRADEIPQEIMERIMDGGTDAE
jgi:hypothetical protein